MSPKTEIGRAELEAAGAALMRPERGLWIAPLRHHSPACAWALRAMIREIRPTHVLIEGPEDFTRHIDALLDAGTRPPVALLALRPPAAGGSGGASARASFSYPLSEHSPEYAALREGRAVGAELRFIDLASAEAASPEEEAAPAPEEGAFSAGAYVAALCARSGRRDGHDLWDHLFEARLGTADWRGFFRDLGAYCFGVRLASPPDARSLRREARMAAHLAAALAEAGASGGRVLAAVGGYHASALAGELPAPAPMKPGEAARSYLLRSGFAALDAQSGYGAGLPSPGYYDRLWRAAELAEGAPDWSRLAADLLLEFAAKARAEGLAAPSPAMVETIRLAESLALLRGSPGPLREDLREAVRMGLAKGEASDADLWSGRFTAFLRGDRLGSLGRESGAPPLLEDARARARALRFSLEDGVPRLRRLEVRRKASHRAASCFLRAMAILETGFGVLRGAPDPSGPPDLTLLHEHWSCGWSPQVEARLAECAGLGETLPAACAARLLAEDAGFAARSRRDDLPDRTALLTRGLLAGLGAELAPISARLAADLGAATDFAALTAALRDLVLLDLPEAPLRAPEAWRLKDLIQRAFRRLLLLCEDLADLPESKTPAVLEALRLLAGLLSGPAGAALEGGAFAAALERLAASPKTPPELLGAALGIGVLLGRRSEAELASALSGFLRGMEFGGGRSALLRGILRTAPALLLREGPLLETTEAFVNGLEERDFLNLLPQLRRSFRALPPEDRIRLAELLARRQEGRNPAAEEADLRRGLAAEAAFQAGLAAEDLADWFAISADPPREAAS